MAKGCAGLGRAGPSLDSTEEWRRMVNVQRAKNIKYVN